MKRYIRASHDWYFGEDEREICGDLIAKHFNGWIISKRKIDLDKIYSLKSVADILQRNYPDICKSYTENFGSESREHEFNMFTVLGALEGMCHENEAVEVADGFYYVGSYSNWKSDDDAHQELSIMMK